MSIYIYYIVILLFSLKLEILQYTNNVHTIEFDSIIYIVKATIATSNTHKNPIPKKSNIISLSMIF